MNTTNRRHSVSQAARALPLVLVLALGACGSDGGSDATVAGGSEPTSAAATTDPGAPGSEGLADPAKFCDTWLQIDSTPSPGGPDGPPPAEEVKSYATSLQPLVATLTEEVPADLESPLTTLSAAVDKAADTGDAAIFEDEAFNRASATGEQWLHDNCGYQNIDATAIDYAYAGLPSSLSPGKTSLLLTNESEHGEMHEFILLKRKAGVTESTQELLALPEEEAFSKVDFVGVAFAPNGQSNGVLLDLEAGDYIAACFLPVEGNDSNPPHFVKGMLAEFTVG